MRALTRRWLEITQGLVEVEEGEKLAELAREDGQTLSALKGAPR